MSKKHWILVAAACVAVIFASVWLWAFSAIQLSPDHENSAVISATFLSVIFACSFTGAGAMFLLIKALQEISS